MAGETLQVAVSILDREYMIACPAEEKAGLLESARILDEKMRDIRHGGKVIGIERIAVMAGLNIAHELLAQREQQGGQSRGLDQRLQRLQERIDAVLGEEDRQLRL